MKMFKIIPFNITDIIAFKFINNLKQYQKNKVF